MPSVKTLLLVFLSIALAGCGAIHTRVKKSDLDVQTKMSESIFLEPAPPSAGGKTVYLSLRNTSDKDLNVKSRIKTRLQAQGYQFVSHPDQANFSLQANVLRVSKDDLRAAQSYLESGVTGAVVGGAVSSDKHTAGAAVIGGLIGIIGDATVDDTLYTMVTDIRLRERDHKAASRPWVEHLTRVVSTANQANLDFDTALPELEKGLVNALSSLFPD